MTSNEFAYYILNLAEETIEALNRTREHVEEECDSDDLATMSYNNGYAEGLLAAKDAVGNFRSAFYNIFQSEKKGNLLFPYDTGVMMNMGEKEETNND